MANRKSNFQLFFITNLYKDALQETPPQPRLWGGAIIKINYLIEVEI